MSVKNVKFNEVPKRVEYSETIEGLYSITNTKTLLQVIDTKSDFSIKISNNRHVRWKAYTINDDDNKSFDTLVIRFMPTKGSGMVYKFYN